MELRPYQPQDLDAILELFYETVHAVNRRDYSPSQLDAWAPKQPDRDRWAQSLAAHYTVVAVAGGTVAGFADLASDGYFDRLFVHKDFQRQGIATALAGWIEGKARELSLPSVCTEASITARPFFEKRGYRVVQEQRKPHNGQVFVNFVMEKRLGEPTHLH